MTAFRPFVRLVIGASLLITSGLLLSACVSTVMKQYIGKDVREAFIEHGQPVHEFVLADGRKVFQFNWGESSAGSPYGMKGGCLISYIAAHDDTRKAWIINEIKYPDRVVC